MTPQRRGYEFHLNGLRKYLLGVAVSLTTALVGQSTALIWWAAKIDTRVTRVEKDVDGLNGRIHTIETSRPLRP
jgi:hypothetical protein